MRVGRSQKKKKKKNLVQDRVPNRIGIIENRPNPIVITVVVLSPPCTQVTIIFQTKYTVYKVIVIVLGVEALCPLNLTGEIRHVLLYQFKILQGRNSKWSRNPSEAVGSRLFTAGTNSDLQHLIK